MSVHKSCAEDAFSRRAARTGPPKGPSCGTKGPSCGTKGRATAPPSAGQAAEPKAGHCGRVAGLPQLRGVRGAAATTQPAALARSRGKNLLYFFSLLFLNFCPACSRVIDMKTILTKPRTARRSGCTRPSPQPGRRQLAGTRPPPSGARPATYMCSAARGLWRATAQHGS